MFAHGIAQVEPPAVGIHLLWMGPHVWVYSPRGWAIQRREYVTQRDRLLCDELDAAVLAKLRAERERPSPLGTFTLRAGLWPTSVGPAASVPCEVVTLELTVPRRFAQITVTARQSFALALREGKVVDVAGPRSGSVAFELRGIAIDTVIVHAIALGSLRVCVDLPADDEERDWSNAPFIVTNLQLPLGELMPALDTPAKEFAEGKSRLLAGESLDEDEFARLMRSLRSGVQQAGPPRPIDQVLLMREEPTADFEELIALDPIRVLLSHPKWRRVLGFAWFDDDPGLEPGKTYEYRITGVFPAEDIHDKVYGFHSIPSHTLLPAELCLHDLRLRVPEPVTVRRAPGTPDSGRLRISRRGIPLQPKQNPWWTLIPPLDDNSLVVDFPSPVTSVVVELHPSHQLRWTAHGFGGITLGPSPVPPGERPRLSFPFPVRQMRLRGTGFLYAIRVPAGPEGLQPLSVVLPPVLLKDTPRPQPPVSASIGNLQQPGPTPIANDVPDTISPRRPALGFEVTWRPALREGLVFWPPDADAAPPLDAAVFQIEHREETPVPAMLPHLLIEGAPTRAGLPRRPEPRLTPEILSSIVNAPMAGARRDSLIRALATGDMTAVHDLVLAAASDWRPVLPDENTTLGDRSAAAGPPLRARIHPGADLMLVFPELPRRGNGESLDLTWDDVFDFEQGGHVVVRPVPAPGTYHRYRVRVVDPIGRPSLTWTETNRLRLEKRVPPPVPVGPDQTPAELLPLPRPTGVQARVIVKNGPGLTPDDLTLLGSDDNVIVLRWGWHAEQRAQDPFATEFRLYRTTKPLDAVAGTLTAVTAIGLGVYEVTIQLERAVLADAARDAPLDAGYPFVAYTHTAGQTITATVGTRVPDAQGNLREPALGPVALYTHLTPNLTRPPAWAERFEVQPITTDTEYHTVLRNRLTLTPDHPRDSIWAGVSAADDQSYVSDQLEPGASRPGNESAIVPILCEARYQGRPDFAIPAALDPVPVLITAEPTARAIEFGLDLTPYLGGTGVTNGDLIRPERASAAAVFTAYRATTDHRVIAKAIDPRSAAETDLEVVVPNPGDRSAIVAALNGARVEALEDRFVVFLAGSHPYADRLFGPVAPQALPLGEFRDSLPPLGERYVYRVRRSDAAGHLSAGGAMAAVVVRVPSMTPGPVPTRAPREAADPPGLVRLRVAPDPTVSHVLTFHQVIANGSRPGGETVVMRIPNRPDTYPAGIRARTANGALLSPEVKALSDADVEVDAGGVRTVRVLFSAAPAERLLVWTCSLTRDGVPSPLAGPFGLVMPPAPLPVPTLAAAQAGAQVFFAWTWPAGDRAALEVALERSLDGVSWQRFSPLFDETTTSYVSTAPNAGPMQYRIVVANSAGRKAFGDPTTPT
jgi:hypothetical protein